ncbi:MAG TPA: MgtC/SapB family protein [Noviherbaspirillum sp.]|jgi:putative Mg2+ transporter-C (MgtC) family protein|uniref:MgtC/SapB family protein n=1 Tax=Noviherbaspirillum sp. TaxID=1926288 RepID=UPI002DDD7B68|nr:MgtC/SapB family protein [Noviherbaspirillum sp.]HEV2611466.1 MgtC/SapB family protein [Noviherbaspirillum sp.]
MPAMESLAAFWSGHVLASNLIVVLSLFGALLLGLLVGYERSYHGRAAGMRTYGLVCMASAALTVIAGYPGDWFGGQNGAEAGMLYGVDPTRIIQGIVTGIGFLGAGVIMKEGLNISGLTTAASIWAASVIGILVGVGFYPAAIGLAVLSAMCMVWIPKLGARLPSRQAVAFTLRFCKGVQPSEERLRRAALERGYEIANGSIAISVRNGQAEWHFVGVALNKVSGAPLTELARELSAFEGVESFQLSHARN